MQINSLEVVKMKSNFNKSKRYAPKNNKKRTLHEISKRDKSPLKTKPLDIDSIKKAQEKVKSKEEKEKG